MNEEIERYEAGTAVRVLAAILSFALWALPVRAEIRVTVAQLEQFLTSPGATKLSDQEIADRLRDVELSDQLTRATLKRISFEAELGPRTSEQLEVIAAVSMFKEPPAVELPDAPPPDAATQEEILESASDYVKGAIHLLPDFFATRVTRSFDNLPVMEGKKHPRPKIEMHFVRETRREVAMQAGREVNRRIGEPEKAVEGTAQKGFSTWGEFGAILAIVLGDSFTGSVTWERWERNEEGTRVAVFRYSVPRTVSHNTVDFCCYAKSDEGPEIYSFHDKPGYHGEVSIDPASGEIDRITVQADLEENEVVTMSDIAVEYGASRIAGKRYVCPIRSVAVLKIHNRAMEKIDGIGLEEHVNVVRFVNYHKFGSTARIMTTSPQQ